MLYKSFLEFLVMSKQIYCKVCNIKVSSVSELKEHLIKHEISPKEYFEKYNPQDVRMCSKCGCLINLKSKTGTCSQCRDRTGENNPFFGKTHSRETRELLQEKCKIATTEMWKNDEYREKVIKGTSKPRSGNFREMQSIRTKQTYIDHPELRELRGKTFKQSWANGNTPINIHSINESAGEKELRHLLEEKFKNTDINIDKKSVRVKSRTFLPDIVLSKEKIIIEYFGDYWHANPSRYMNNDIIHHKITAYEIWNNDIIRKNLFESIGYKFFYVWASDFLNNKSKVVDELYHTILQHEYTNEYVKTEIQCTN